MTVSGGTTVVRVPPSTCPDSVMSTAPVSPIQYISWTLVGIKPPVCPCPTKVGAVRQVAYVACRGATGGPVIPTPHHTKLHHPHQKNKATSPTGTRPSNNLYAHVQFVHVCILHVSPQKGRSYTIAAAVIINAQPVTRFNQTRKSIQGA